MNFSKSQWMTVLGAVAAVCMVLAPELVSLGPEWTMASRVVAIVGVVVTALNQNLRTKRSDESDNTKE